MKIKILKYLSLFSISIIVLIAYLSLIGIETDKFNNQIKSKVIQTNKNLDFDLKKIKLTLDPINFNINAKTVGATIYYSKRPIQLEYLKTQFSLSSFIKNKIISTDVEIVTRSILINDLIKFIRAINNKPELFVLDQVIENGYIILDASLSFDDKGNLKNDYEINGLLKDGKIDFLKKNVFENINFNFNLKKDNFSFEQIKFSNNKINFFSDSLIFEKKKDGFFVKGDIKNNRSKLNKDLIKLLNLDIMENYVENVNFDSINKFSFEIDNKFKFENIILSSDINIDELKYKKPDLIDSYFSDINDIILFKDHKIKVVYKNNNLSAEGEGKIQIEEATDIIKYFIKQKNKELSFSSNLFLKNINLKTLDFLRNFFPQLSDTINLQNQKLKIDYKNNNLFFSGSGKFRIDKDYEEIKYSFEKTNNKIIFDTKLNLKKTNFEIDKINYKKNNKTIATIKINGEIKNLNKLSINKFIVNEENNKIYISNLILNDTYQIIEIKEANFNYLDTENKKNNFSVFQMKGNDYKIEGTSFNANSLISNLLKSDDSKENKYFKNNTNIDFNLEKVQIDEIYFVNGFNGKLSIINNKVTSANFNAVFESEKKIFFTINKNSQGEKITTLTSSKAKPLVNRYKFIKGFKDGNESFLDFYSVKKNNVSNSKLIIDNFKVKEIPALAKLLALASLQGIADLLTGEGIRFTDFEMKFTNEKKLMTIQELYAIGPAISVLMEGYIEADNLISLRGTLVPATTINRSIASIPLIGDLLIGKKVGEGVFGVSFKIKGPPKKLETTVNPIKTLTPRFITRTLEKIKKN